MKGKKWVFFIPFFISIFFLNFALLGGGDNYMYLILARSIREHGRYVNLHIPGEPPHTKFPPLFPLLLAIFSGGRSIVGAKLLVIFTYWILLFFVFRFYNEIDRKNGWILFLFFSVPPYLLLYAQSIYSDIPYTLFSFLTLYFIFLYEKRKEQKYLYFSLIFAIAAFYTRTIGITLLSVPLFLFLRKRKKEGFIYGIILIVAMALWFGRNKLVGGKASEYFEQWKLVNPYIPQAGVITWRDIFIRIINNLLNVIFHQIGVLFTGFTHSLSSHLGKKIFSTMSFMTNSSSVLAVVVNLFSGNLPTIWCILSRLFSPI